MTTASPLDPLGYDVKVGLDLDPSGRAATGLELVEDGMLHRLSQGSLLLTGAPDDQVEFGEDVRAWVGEALVDGEIESRAPLVELILRRDPRIANVSVVLSLLTPDDAPEVNFTIAVQATTVSGQSISRVIGVSSLTVAFLATGT